jgi:ATP-dependent Lon protease
MRYLLKELTDNIGLRTDDVVINSEVMGYVLKHYCKRQKGVRQLKKCLESLLLKINTARFAGFARYKTFREGMKLPLKLTTEMVDELLADMREPLDKYVLSMYI